MQTNPKSLEPAALNDLLCAAAAGTGLGSWPRVRCSELARCREIAPAAVVSADKTRLHRHHRERRDDAEEFLAFPNDRAASIRPASPHRQYR